MLPAMTDSRPVAKSKSALARAMEQFRAKRQPVTIGLIVDATGSRAQTWERAQTIQARMFKTIASLRSLSLRLLHFGGNELTDHGWREDPRHLAAKMAAVQCASGLTQILPALDHFLDDTAPTASAIILIGDCFEECSEEAEHIARRLAAQKIKVFSFLEGEDGTAQAVFKRLADVTGGRFAQFGGELPLGDLCEGVALLTAGGDRAVKHLKNKRVAQLLLTGPTRNT